MNELNHQDLIIEYNERAENSLSFSQKIGASDTESNIYEKLRLEFIKEAGFIFNTSYNGVIRVSNIDEFKKNIFKGFNKDEINAINSIIDYNWITESPSHSNFRYNNQFKIFLHTMWKAMNIKVEIEFIIEGEKAKIDLNSKDDVKFFNELYNMLNNEIKSNDGNREKIDKLTEELIKLKEVVSEINDKNKILEKTIIEQNIEGIISSLIELIPGAGKYISAIYKTIKSNKKLITATQEIKLDSN